jgi:DHA2 family multidrug resistance protein
MSAEAAPPPSLTSEEDYRLDLRRLLIVISTMLAVLLEIIDTSIVNVAVPTMMGNLGATLDEIDWVITAYIVANVIIIPMTGWLAGRFGRKRYFTTSILIFTGASLMCGASNTVDMLIFWRVIQGLGGGALMATSQAILVESFPASKQGVGQAIFGVGAMIGPSLGPTLGGFLTDNYSWHWCFLINGPIGLLAATLCAAYLDDPPHLVRNRTGRVDWPGIAFLVIGVGCFQTLLERGNREDWFASPAIVALAAGAVIGIAALLWRELTTDQPVIDFRVLRSRSFAVGCALTAMNGMALYGLIFLFPVYAQNLLGWTAWQSGLAVLPSSLATAAVMALVGRLVWHAGPRILFLAGMGMMLVTLTVMSSWTLQSSVDAVLIAQFLRGISSGLLFVPLSTATLRALPSASIAKGAGLYNLFRQLGGSFGIAILASILDRRSDVHRAELARHLSPFEPSTRLGLDRLGQHLQGQGLDAPSAEFAARAVVDRMLDAQATMEAFYDAFYFIAIVFIVMLPLAFLVARHSPGKFEPVD